MVVEGRVQGVGFRAFAKKLAEGFGVVGWISNLADGRVEVVLEGKRNDVEAIAQKLHDGPKHAAVNKVEVSFNEPTAEYSSFVIRT